MEIDQYLDITSTTLALTFECMLRVQCLTCCSLHVDSLKTIINDWPTMPTLLNFPLSTGKRINVAVEIGTKYDDFSIQLLQDDNGNILDQIYDGFGPQSEHILKEVFKRWLNGVGKLVKTWRTIIQVLKDIKILTLAESLESELTE